MTRAAKTASFALFLFAALALPMGAQTTAAARPDPEQLFRNPRQLAKYLKLTPTQVTTFKQLYEQLQATLKPLREEQRALSADLHEALDAASPDACAIGQIHIDLHEGREEIRAALEAFDDAFSAILTPQQLTRWNALKEALKFFSEAPAG